MTTDQSDNGFEQRLTGMLYRYNCPTADELGDFVLDMVDAEMREVIQLHVQHCPLCREEIETLQAFLEKDDPPLQDMLPIDDSAPTVEPSIRRGNLVPASAGIPAMRGVQAKSFKYDFQDDIALYISIREEASSIVIDGQFTVVNPETSINLSGALVEFWQSGRPVAITFVDRQYSFVSEIVQPIPTVVRIKALSHPMLSCELQIDMD